MSPPAKPTDQELKEFAALTTHAEKCAYFAKHPALGHIYRANFFELPDQTQPVIAATSVKPK